MAGVDGEVGRGEEEGERVFELKSVPKDLVCSESKGTVKSCIGPKIARDSVSTGRE